MDRQRVQRLGLLRRPQSSDQPRRDRHRAAPAHAEADTRPDSRPDSDPDAHADPHPGSDADAGPDDRADGYAGADRDIARVDADAGPDDPADADPGADGQRAAAPVPTPTPDASTPSEPPGSPGGGTIGSGGGGAAGGGSTSNGGGGGSGPAPESELDVGQRDPLGFAGLDAGGSIGAGVFEWAVPGAILAGPGLLLMLLIAAQAVGALAWLPLVRRRIGSFGPVRRRRASGSA